MKKLGLIIMSSMLLLHTMFFYAAPADAAYSKVATATAKKVAKEMVESSAVQMAMDIVFNYEMNDIMKNGYKTDSGYTAVCMEKQGDKCIKPMQAKVPSTAAEKKTLADKVEQVLERKTGTAGWGKYLDWIVPIFLLGGAAAWIESKFDSDSKGLFDDIAKESLDETGFVKGIDTKDVLVIDEQGQPVMPEKQIVTGNSNLSVIEPVQIENSIAEENVTKFEHKFSGTFAAHGYGVVIDFEENVNSESLLNNVQVAFPQSHNVQLTKSPSANQIGMWRPNHGMQNGFNMTYQGITQKLPTGNYYLPTVPFNVIPEMSQTEFFKLKRLMIFQKAVQSDWFVLQYVWITQSGKQIVMESGGIPEVKAVTGDLKVTIDIGATYGGRSAAYRVSVFPSGFRTNLEGYKPNLKEFPEIDFLNMPYHVGDGVVKIPSPTVVPIKTPEGVPVKPNGDGGWEQLDGTPIDVDEDTLIVEDIQKTPEGDGIITPDGNEVPLPKPDDAPPASDGGNQENEFVCQRDLKDIDFKAVSSSFTTSFPFSIPWDIKRFVDNALGTIGEGKKPEIELAFLGDGVMLTMPDMIDDWMPFLRNVVIIMFDISLVYLFFRWTKGGGD